MEEVDREALVHNESPYVLAYCPPGDGKRSAAGVVVDGAAVEVTAFKRSEDGRDAVVRLFEPTGRARRVTVKLPAPGARTTVGLKGFEIKTLRYDRRKGTFAETDLLERKPVKR
jgi:alpha-mannosidase